MKGDGSTGHRRRRGRDRALTFGAAGLGLVAALGATWWYRTPLASSLIRWQLASRGIDSDFRIERLGLAGADLSAVRLGPEAYPEAAAMRAEVRFAWRPLPVVDSVRLIEPRLRVRVNEGGVSLGTLDGLLKERGKRRTELPRWVLEIVHGEAILETPYGTLPASAASNGRIGEDFQGEVRLPRADRTAGADRLHGAEGVLSVRSSARGLLVDLNLTTADFVRRGASGEDLRLSARLAAPNDLANARVDLEWRAKHLSVDGSRVRGLQGRLELQGALQETALAFADWRASTRSGAVTAETDAVILDTPQLESSFTGDAHGGRGRWNVASRTARMEGWRAAGAAGGGEAVLEFGEKLALSSQGALTLQQAQLTAVARADLRRRWPQLGGTPFAAFMETSAQGLDRALRGFTLNAPFAFTLRNDEGMLSFTTPVEARAASGAIARFRPLRSDTPMFRMKLGDGITNFSGVLEVGGGGLPITILTIDRFSRIRNEPIIVGGSFVAPDWRARPAAELAATSLKTLLTIRDGSVDLRVVGPLEISGPAGAADVRNLVAPLDLAFHWGRGFRLASHDGRCMNVRFGRLSLPGVELANGAAAICPVDGAFFAVDAQGRATGGFALASPSFSGHIAGEPAQRTQLGAQQIVGRFGGGNGAETTLDIVAEAPRVNIRFAEGRDVAIAGARLTARSRSAVGIWRAEGVLDNGELRDPALPANIGGISARWAAEPRGDDAVIRVLEGKARLTDRPPQDAPADHRSRFNPLLLTGVSADLVAGRVVGRGDIRLEQGERTLATFEAVHDLESASGQAHVRARDFVFSKNLQPFEISELLRGVIEKVEGPLEADVDLDWTPGALTGTGRLATTDLSLASATLPVVRGVAGEIAFSDIFTLSTPPAQRLSIRELNPGVEVRDGVVQFQLLGDGRVAIESAAWPFAGGSVAVAPGTVTLGSRETRFNLLLRDIDVALLLQHLKAPDLTATGQVEGEFPLLLTSTAALVEQGTLRAAIGGGTIAYVGRAREEATGIARIAFEALSNFRYDSLALELNGDLGGDVIAAIVFTGHNEAALNMTSATPGAFIPVVGRAGIPFKFNVRITAPFRTLAQTAAGISDPGIHVRRALDPVLTPNPEPTPPAAPTTVDPPAPSPR